MSAGERVFVHDLPGGASRLVQRATGIEYTLVNGRVVLERGWHSGNLPGKTIRSTPIPGPFDKLRAGSFP